MLSVIAIEQGLVLGNGGQLAVEKFLSSTIQKDTKGAILVGRAAKDH